MIRSNCDSFMCAARHHLAVRDCMLGGYVIYCKLSVLMKVRVLETLQRMDIFIWSEDGQPLSVFIPYLQFPCSHFTRIV